MATDIFYASVIAESGSGTAVTLSGAATLVEALTTASDSKTVTLEAVADTATSKVIQCSSFKRVTDDVALSSAVGANDTLLVMSASVVARAIVGDTGVDVGQISAQALRVYDTATQTWATAGTPRQSADMTFNEATYTTLDVSGWAVAQPTLALVRSSTLAVGFKCVAEGSSISCTSEIDRVYITIVYTPAPSVSPRSRAAFRNWRGVR